VQSHWEHVRLKALPPVRVDGREGGQVVLTCSATGSPAPSVAWYKVSHPPLPSHPTSITLLKRDWKKMPEKKSIEYISQSWPNNWDEIL
jgi:hypothetical protein